MKSLIQAVNTSVQAVSPTATSYAIVSLGNVVRRYGDNLKLNGTAVEETGAGYYEITGTVTVAPTAVGTVTVAVLENGEIMPGTLCSSSVSTATNPVTIPFVATSRVGCCCGTSSISVAVTAGAGNVTNVSLRVVKS